MPALPPILVIARLTVQEASRRRLLLALVILTLIVVGISAWGFYKITNVTGPNGKPPSHEEVIIVSSQLLIFVTFVYSGVLALSAAVVAGPLISNEVESGLILSVLARPVRRSEIVIGKWLGLAILVTIYAVGSAALEMTAGQCMTRTPQTILKGELASAALNLMERRKILAVVVVDHDGRALGVVHLHDLWTLELI